MDHDRELLRQFADEGSQAAFAALVRGKINLVYAAALRQTGGDAALAEDVTQAVFLTLARDAARLKRHAVLAGWLFTTTRFIASKAVRTQRRWQRREHEANAMNLTRDDGGASQWDTLRPVVDEALHELGAGDRDALVLRYFEGRSLAEVGAAIGLNENSARMRVDRALEKLRTRLARRGVTSTAAALGLALAGQPVVAAPAGLAATVAGSALAGATLAGGGGLATALWLLEFMQTTKLALGTLGAVAAVGLGAYLGFNYRAPGAGPAETSRATASDASLTALRDENRALKEQLAQSRAAAPAPAATGGAGTPVSEPPAGPSLVPMRLLAELQRKKWVDPQMTFVDRSGKITDSFAGLFSLSPAEQQTLQATVDRAREQLADLERANATVTPQPDGKIEIRVKSFPEAGGLAYNELMEGFARTLGPERDAVYRSLGAEQVELALGRFGAMERTVTISRKPPGERTKPTDAIVVRDETRTRGQSNTNSSDYKDMNEVATRIGTLVRLVPPNF